MRDDENESLTVKVLMVACAAAVVLLCIFIAVVTYSMAAREWRRHQEWESERRLSEWLDERRRDWRSERVPEEFRRNLEEGNQL